MTIEQQRIAPFKPQSKPLMTFPVFKATGRRSSRDSLGHAWNFLKAWGIERKQTVMNRLRYLYLYLSARLTRNVNYGRHCNPYPIRCDCGWVGRRMDARHGYRTAWDDVEAVDFCPKCQEEI